MTNRNDHSDRDGILAARYAPTIIQEVAFQDGHNRGKFDLLAQVPLNDHNTEDTEKTLRAGRTFSAWTNMSTMTAVANILRPDNGIWQPHVYYKVTEYPGNQVFVLYCFFHRKDFARWPDVLGVDEHEYDFEGVLVFDTGNPIIDDEAHHYMIGRAHNGFHGWSNIFGGVEVLVESGSHAIREPMGRDYHNHGRIVYTPSSYRLINMEREPWYSRFRELEPVWAKHGVTPPWKWGDGRIWRDPKGFAEEMMR